MATAAASRKTYFLVFGALLFLTLLTAGVAYVDLGPLSFAVALAIAMTKAALVMLFFMHLNHSGFLVKVFAGAGVLWLLHMLTFTLADYLSR
ncbi:MAG: cytochrome C oxidase subunit IV family protein [Candidatus Binatia bacterium]